jgi:hypothetical protein
MDTDKLTNATQDTQTHLHMVAGTHKHKHT